MWQSVILQIVIKVRVSPWLCWRGQQRMARNSFCGVWRLRGTVPPKLQSHSLALNNNYLDLKTIVSPCVCRRYCGRASRMWDCWTRTWGGRCLVSCGPQMFEVSHQKEIPRTTYFNSSLVLCGVPQEIREKGTEDEDKKKKRKICTDTVKSSAWKPRQRQSVCVCASVWADGRRVVGPNRKANWCESDPVCELDLVKRSGVGSYVVPWRQGPLYVLGSGPLAFMLCLAWFVLAPCLINGPFCHVFSGFRTYFCICFYTCFDNGMHDIASSNSSLRCIDSQLEHVITSCRFIDRATRSFHFYVAWVCFSIAQCNFPMREDMSWK